MGYERVFNEIKITHQHGILFFNHEAPPTILASLVFLSTVLLPSHASLAWGCGGEKPLEHIWVGDGGQDASIFYLPGAANSANIKIRSNIALFCVLREGIGEISLHPSFL